MNPQELTIADFSEPKSHPYGMLSGLRHACEKEGMLVWILLQCLTAGDLYAIVTTKHTHPTMVDAGLLEECEDHKYCLTEKSAGLLHKFYPAVTRGAS